MTIIGQILLWSGFLGAALAAVCRIESAGIPPWQTIEWTWYAVSMTVGVVGVAVLRASSRAAAQHSVRVEGEFEMLETSLAILQQNIGDLCSRQDTTELQKTVSFIDSQCAEPFSDFADSRNALIQRFGLQGFAEVMTQFASAERFVNRALVRGSGRIPGRNKIQPRKCQTPSKPSASIDGEISDWTVVAFRSRESSA